MATAASASLPQAPAAEEGCGGVAGRLLGGRRLVLLQQDLGMNQIALGESDCSPKFLAQ